MKKAEKLIKAKVLEAVFSEEYVSIGTFCDGLLLLSARSYCDEEGGFELCLELDQLLFEYDQEDNLKCKSLESDENTILFIKFLEAKCDLSKSFEKQGQEATRHFAPSVYELVKKIEKDFGTKAKFLA